VPDWLAKGITSGFFRVVPGAFCCLIVALELVACARRSSLPEKPEKPVLTMMPTAGGLLDLTFTDRALELFDHRLGVSVKNIAAYDSIDTRLELLEQLFRQRSPQPDICEIDNIWPGLLANSLLDLRPYLDEELSAIDPEMLRAFTVDGKLLALPLTMDTAVLYYRTDLLRKYGYHHPPGTWDELARIASVIQRGERRSGNKDFWGFLWQGAAGESLTCDAMEWQMAEGGGRLLGDDRTVNAANERCKRAIERAASWVGTISPPSVLEYDEEDSINLWNDGNAAFLRGWLDVYRRSRRLSSISDKFEVAPLPAGSRGRSWTFGGMGLAVPKYSHNPDAAVKLVRFLVSADVQRRRASMAGEVPTRIALLNDNAVLANTPFHGTLQKHWREGMFARPSTISGNNYDRVSRAYSNAVHEALSRRVSVSSALRNLQRELVQITGFRAVQ
jgi:trehalose/maltose transport system substrate-binding protein